MKNNFILNLASGILAYSTLFTFTETNARVQLVGYLSNFDVDNQTGSPMEGFEIDIPGLSSSDLHPSYPNYCGSAFGCGAGHNTSTGLGVGYGNSGPNPNVAVGNPGITQFGAQLKKTVPGAINYNWLNRNANDGKLYYQGTSSLAAGYPLPPSPPPAVSNETVVSPKWEIHSSNQLLATITDTLNHPYWVLGVSAEDNTLLTLDHLFSTDPLFLSLTMAESQLLEPGDTLSLSEPDDDSCQY